MRLDLDRSTWKRVRFGDVVINRNDSVRDPAAAGIDRVIAMEHLEPGSLRVARWGDPSDGTTFTRRVRPGQTLFGKRRAYQRKVAYADFDAICSGDILVFEARSDLLLPELLPFVVLSDGFFDHALGTSAGSLSPRTRWSDLARYEIALPPIPDQQRIADMCWAAERAGVAAAHATRTAYTCARARLSASLACASGPKRKLGEMLTLSQYGSSTRAAATGRYPMLRMTNLLDGSVVGTDLTYADLSDREFTAHRVEPGDVLFNRTNSYELVGRSGLFDLPGDYVFASYLVRLRPSAEMLSEYLNLFINSPLGQSLIRVHVSRGVSQANISASKLRQVALVVPPLDEQRAIVLEYLSLRASVRVAQRGVDATRDLGVDLQRLLLGA